jgi:hypothetical protein
MSAMDPQQERERLARSYRDLPDDEIERLAREESTLADLARELLRAEIARRGLAVVLAGGPATPTFSKLATIRRFRDAPKALVAKSVLESAEIECFLADDIIVRLRWYWSYAVGGVRLQVAEEEAEASIALLDQPIIESFAVPDVGEYVQPRCPNCDSLDISLGASTSLARYLMIAVAAVVVLFIFPFQRAGWSCNACGNRWDGDREASPAPPVTR